MDSSVSDEKQLARQCNNARQLMESYVRTSSNASRSVIPPKEVGRVPVMTFPSNVKRRRLDRCPIVSGRVLFSLFPWSWRSAAGMGFMCRTQRRLVNKKKSSNKSTMSWYLLATYSADSCRQTYQGCCLPTYCYQGRGVADVSCSSFRDATSRRACYSPTATSLQAGEHKTR